MRFPLLFTFALALLVAAPTAEAQVARGDREMNASSSLTVSGGDVVFNLQGFLGFFLNDRIEVGPIANLLIADEVSLIQLGGFGSYHFSNPGATTVPFVSAELLVGLGDLDGFIIGGQAGLKYFVADGAALVPAAFLRIPDEGDAAFGAQFGISIFF